MPLNGKDESLRRHLDSLNGVVLRVNAADAETFPESADGLMVPGIDVPRFSSGDRGQKSSRLDANLMNRPTAVLRPLTMTLGPEVLHQSAAVANVHELQASADRQHRQIFRNCLEQKRCLYFIADGIGRVGLGCPRFSKSARAYVDSTHQHKACKPGQVGLNFDVMQFRFNSRLVQSSLIRLGAGKFPIRQ
ncbi:MAG: hypothetical protein WKF37_13935 [Bryobacteraceae bacterium]